MNHDKYHISYSKWEQRQIDALREQYRKEEENDRWKETINQNMLTLMVVIIIGVAVIAFFVDWFPDRPMTDAENAFWTEHGHQVVANIERLRDNAKRMERENELWRKRFLNN